MVALLPAIIGLGFFLGYVFLFLPLDDRDGETSRYISQAMLEYHEANVLTILTPNETVPGTGAAVIDGQIHPAFPNLGGFRTAHYFITTDGVGEERTVVILTWADPDLIGSQAEVKQMIRILQTRMKNDPLEIDAGVYSISPEETSGSLSQGMVGTITFEDAPLGSLGALGMPAIVSLHPR